MHDGYSLSLLAHYNKNAQWLCFAFYNLLKGLIKTIAVQITFTGVYSDPECLLFLLYFMSDVFRGALSHCMHGAPCQYTHIFSCSQSCICHHCIPVAGRVPRAAWQPGVWVYEHADSSAECIVQTQSRLFHIDSKMKWLRLKCPL